MAGVAEANETTPASEAADIRRSPAHGPIQSGLLDNAPSIGWRNPTPDGRYNLVAIGSGTAGLVASIGGQGWAPELHWWRSTSWAATASTPAACRRRASSARPMPWARSVAGEPGVHVPDGVSVDFGGGHGAHAGDPPASATTTPATRHRHGRRPLHLAAAFHRPRHGGGGPRRRALTLRFAKAVIATGSRQSASRRAGRGRDRLPHQRDDLRADGTAAAAGRHRRRPIGAEMA